MVAGTQAPITYGGLPPASGAFLGALATYSNGQTRYVEAEWTTSDPNVLTVTDNVLTAVGRGTATLTATAGGQSDSEVFVVEGGIAGRWSGTYVIDQCVGTGSIQDVFCSAGTGNRPGGAFPVGSTLPIALEVTQTGFELSGTVAFGQISGPVTGVVRAPGVFQVQGTARFGDVTLLIAHWDTRVTGNTMEGFINYEARVRGLPGFAGIVTHLVKVERR